MGVEPTRGTRCRTSGLKSVPGTGQDWLPSAIVTRAAVALEYGQ